MTPWGYLVLAAIALWVLLATLELVAVFAVPTIFLVCLPVAMWRLWWVARASPGAVRRHHGRGVPSERLTRALEEFDGLTGLYGVKAEVGRL